MQETGSAEFTWRHIGPRPAEIEQMLRFLGRSTLGEVVDQTVPPVIRAGKPLDTRILGHGKTEPEALAELREIASRNRVFRSLIGMGYSGCITPPVIQRNILENPGWYTQYTPYQAEIAQGRLEALLNFQTMIIDLTGLPVANASLLDEGTAAAEAMALCFSMRGPGSAPAFFVSERCHPQTIAVLRTRAEPLGIEIRVGDHETFDFSGTGGGVFGAIVQYPDTEGVIHDYAPFIERAHSAGAKVVMAADLLALALLKPPGELGADVAVGSTQRFGVPMGFGGPHAAFFSTRDELKRQIPGRIVGLSKDVDGKPAARLALQTREQHIRRDKATSNICTAQVLLAVIASMYAVYHGPEGLKRIAERTHFLTSLLKAGLERLGYRAGSGLFFDTLKVDLGSLGVPKLVAAAERRGMNFRPFGASAVGISLDELSTEQEIDSILGVFAEASGKQYVAQSPRGFTRPPYPVALRRASGFLSHAVFNSHHSETEMLRYLRRLEARDLSLTTSMIPLGSCTMKLNATAEMFPLTWRELSAIHPFAPGGQTLGYQELLSQLEGMLREITGLDAISLQPNAGSQGEYAGLLVIRRYHRSRGENQRDVCLIPRSAHGTNPASAAMAGLRVVVVECDSKGNVDPADLRQKAKEHAARLAALMITYPSTHGVFEAAITDLCDIVHQGGGLVYMDGANMNAQVGLCRPGDFGADVCHLNLHKTFCIPHGGGGPGMGPIGVKALLAPFLPTHPVVPTGGSEGIGPVSAAPWGSASILPISWMYIRMMGGGGLKLATEVAILSANYVAKRLGGAFPVLYSGKEGFVAHECIFDFRQFKETAGIDVEDVAKRLMDYGFHAPTVSFPVAGTVMVEPTESESKAELDRFCEAMLLIREEIAEIERGEAGRTNNLLKNAPHTAEQIARADWARPYSRERAVFPAPWTRQAKFWPSVGRINNVLGDRNLVCSCPPTEAYA